MNWIIGLQKAIDYIEDHLTESIDYETVAAQSFSSVYHFQRVFSILCGYTLGEYIRYRRLTLAGIELSTTDSRVIDIALKYCYENPDSFSKAFQKFHGILPSAARSNARQLKAFSRLVLKFSLEGGTTMNYRIEEKPNMIFTGYKRRFSGTPQERYQQEHDFYVQTRANQYILHGLARDCDTQYNLILNHDDDGYDYYIASLLDTWHTENLQEALGAEDSERFEQIVFPGGLYIVCETERCKAPVDLVQDLRKQIVTEWLPSSGYELRRAPEVSVIHWYYENKKDRFIEIWLPIQKF